MKSILFVKNDCEHRENMSFIDLTNSKNEKFITEYRLLYSKTRLKEKFELLEAYSSNEIDDFLYTFKEEASSTVKELEKKLIVKSLIDLISSNIALTLNVMKMLNFQEIYSLDNKELIKVDTLIQMFVVIKEVEEEEENKAPKKVGRPKIKLDDNSRKLVIDWIKGNISTDQCIELTGYSRRSLFKLKKSGEFDEFIPPKVENPEELIEKYLKGKISFDLLVTEMNYSRTHVFTLIDQYLAKNDVFELAKKQKLFDYSEELEKATFDNIALFQEQQNLKEVSLVKYSFESLKYNVYKVQRLGKKTINLEGNNISRFLVENQDYFILPQGKDPQIMIKDFITKRLATYDLDEDKFPYIESNSIFMKKVKEYMVQQFKTFEEKEQFINHIEYELYSANKTKSLLLINKAVKKLEEKLLNIWRERE